MKSITIHNLDDALDKEIKKLAHKNKLSLNKTIKALLRKSTHLDSNKYLCRDYDEFSGIWSKKEADHFNKALKEFEKINPKEWR